MDLAQMRAEIVKDILDNRDAAIIRRAVEEYVEGYSDQTIKEMYREIAS